MKMDFGIVEGKCPVCKKKFFYKATYVYKIFNTRRGKFQHVCSWKCQMDYEKAVKEVKERKKWERKNKTTV